MHIILRSDETIPGLDMIGVTSSHNFQTGSISEFDANRFGNSIWMRVITEGEANAVHWLWTNKSTRKIPDPDGDEEVEWSTGNIKITKTPADVVNAISLGKIVQKKILSDLYDKKFHRLISQDSIQERYLWKNQLKEAKAYQLDNAVINTPILDVLITGRVTTKADLATSIIAKADAFDVALSTLINEQKIINDEINACTTLIELMALTFEGINN